MGRTFSVSALRALAYKTLWPYLTLGSLTYQHCIRLFWPVY
jgi:hypothetical protein